MKVIKNVNKQSAFTIVELLVVIVVIGILAAITIVSYSGIRNRAVTTAIKAQLVSDSNVLKMYYIENSIYPTTLDSNYCPATPIADTEFCLKNMSSSTLTYTGSADTFLLIITDNSTGIAYSISEDNVIAEATSGPAVASFIKTIGLAGSSVAAYNATKSADGGYVIVGLVYGFGAGQTDAVIVKINSSGELVWKKTLGGVDYDNIRDIEQATDGGYVIAGDSSSYGVNGSVIVAKLNSLGDVMWSKTLDGSQWEEIGGIAQSSDNGVIIAATTGSYGVNKSFIAKIDSLGNLSWTKSLGGSGIENYVRDILYDSASDSYVITGDSGPDSAFVAKLNSSGDVLWSKVFNGGVGVSIYGDSIARASDGSYIAVGELYDTGAGNHDSFIAKFNALGSLSWSKKWGGINSELARDLVQTSDGGYVITSETASYGHGNEEEDILLTKLDASGNSSWHSTLGGAELDDGAKVIQDSEGAIVVIGTQAYGTDHDRIIFGKYESDGSIDACTSLECQEPGLSIASPLLSTNDASLVANNQSLVSTSISPTFTSISLTEMSPNLVVNLQSTPIVSSDELPLVDN